MVAKPGHHCTIDENEANGEGDEGGQADRCFKSGVTARELEEERYVVDWDKKSNGSAVRANEQECHGPRAQKSSWEYSVVDVGEDHEVLLDEKCNDQDS